MSGPSEQKREEQNLFEAFRKACPGFSCRECYLPEHDPPDVIYVDASGRRIGIEIGQWAHQGEMPPMPDLDLTMEQGASRQGQSLTRYLFSVCFSSSASSSAWGTLKLVCRSRSTVCANSAK